MFFNGFPLFCAIFFSQEMRSTPLGTSERDKKFLEKSGFEPEHDHGKSPTVLLRNVEHI